MNSHNPRFPIEKAVIGFVLTAITLVVLCLIFLVKHSGARDDAARSRSAAADVNQLAAETGSLPAPEYFQVDLLPPEGSYKTALVFPPATNEWPVDSAADVLNLSGKHGWSLVWISGDGSHVVLKKGPTATSIFYTLIPKTAQ